MNYLLIDTATKKAQIALADEEKIISFKTWESAKLSESLLPEIDNLFTKIGKKPEDLDAIIAYLGPGSYTGLRIGITVANAFAYSLGIVAAGVRGKALGKEKLDIVNLEPIDLNDLFQKGKKELMKTKPYKYLVPFYGKEPNIGKPRSCG